MELEAQLEASQSEVLDLQRAIVKVQTWYVNRHWSVQYYITLHFSSVLQVAQVL